MCTKRLISCPQRANEGSKLFPNKNSHQPESGTVHARLRGHSTGGILSVIAIYRQSRCYDPERLSTWPGGMHMRSPQFWFFILASQLLYAQSPQPSNVVTGDCAALLDHIKHPGVEDAHGVNHPTFAGWTVADFDWVTIPSKEPHADNLKTVVPLPRIACTPGSARSSPRSPSSAFCSGNLRLRRVINAHVRSAP